MTQPVTTSLARIEQGLTGLGRTEVLRLLRPGRSSRYTRRVMSSCGVRSIEDLEAVYGVWNGTEARLAGQLGDMWMFPGFYLLTLEDAAAQYRALTADLGWSTGWWPVFADGGGDFLVVDLDGESLGAVRRFRVGEDEHSVEYQSLSLMLATVAAGFERGLFYVDDAGYLEVDDVTYSVLADACNPGVLRCPGDGNS